MSENTRTVQDALNDAIKKRDRLKNDKAIKINRISNYFEAKIRKFDLYIEMLSGESEVKDQVNRIHTEATRQITMPPIPPVADIPEVGQAVIGGKPTRAQIIRTIFQRIGKPMRVMEIIAELESGGHKVEGAQPYGTVQNAMIRNSEIFCKFPDRSWGLVEWREKGQDHEKEKKA